MIFDDSSDLDTDDDFDCEESDTNLIYDDSSDLDLDDLSEEEFDESWMDQCRFNCCLCLKSKKTKTEFNTISAFESHTTTVHKKTFVQFKRDVQNPCSLLKLIKCEICNDAIVCERNSVIQHLATHSILPKKYYELYECK